MSHPSQSDLFILFRMWVKSHKSKSGCDARVSNWLKDQIELARVRDAEPSKAAEEFVSEEPKETGSKGLVAYNYKNYPL